MYATRKSDMDAWDVLLEIIQTDLLNEIADLMRDRAGGDWSVNDVSKALNEAGFVRKRVHKRATEADPLCQCGMASHSIMTY